MVTKTTNITLKCNRSLHNVEDARFDIIEDDIRLGIVSFQFTVYSKMVPVFKVSLFDKRPLKS